MTQFPVQYDAQDGVIRLDGTGCASVMLSFLLKAKFGEGFDPEVLFHPQLAAMMSALSEQAIIPPATERGPFDRTTLGLIARRIVGESSRSGWWQMSREQQIAFIQNVVVAPHRLSADQLDCLFDDVDSEMFRLRETVQAADHAKDR